jgi:hypothetical protein
MQSEIIAAMTSSHAAILNLKTKTGDGQVMYIAAGSARIIQFRSAKTAAKTITQMGMKHAKEYGINKMKLSELIKPLQEIN